MPTHYRPGRIRLSEACSDLAQHQKEKSRPSMSTYGELAREMEAEDLLEAPPSCPWPFSAGGSLLLEAAAEEMLLRAGSLCSAGPAPPSILPQRDAHGGKARGLRSATTLIRRRGAAAG